MDFLDNDDDDRGFSINKDYAQRYDRWRKGEELQKLKDKYGNDYVNESSSSSEEEDHAAVELTPKIEADFFKTLAYLKTKDPSIYDNNVRFFEKKEEGPSLPKKEKTPSMSMAAFHRKMLLDSNGDAEQIADEQPLDELPMVQQEKVLKESFKKALADDSDEEDDKGMGGLFKPKAQTEAEKEKLEADYRQWLAGQSESEPQQSSDWKGLRDYWANPELNEGEKFLRDYILNQRYLENDDGELHLSSDEDDTVEKQEEFERKFNFRFQEPDQDFIKRFPRTVEQSMRKKDDRRQKHREEVKERKQRERAQKDEELKRLKALKREEIMEKIKKLQDVTGNDDLGFQDQDIDGDFNPEEHDKRMAELFGSDYYGNSVDEKKPEFPELDEELEIENWENWEGGEVEEGTEPVDPHCEDDDFVMDCDYDPKAATQRELKENSKGRRKRRQSKFAEALAKPKPLFDPKDSKFEKYLDDYYSLNYEDLIGDIPCRFKYRKTVPNDYGLTIEEILAAPDRELNRWASAKKIIRRRPDHVEMNEVKTYKIKARNFEKKKLCLPTLYAPPEDDELEQVTEPNPKKKNEKSMATPAPNQDESSVPGDSASLANDKNSNNLFAPKKRKKSAGETTNKKLKQDSGVLQVELSKKTQGSLPQNLPNGEPGRRPKKANKKAKVQLSTNSHSEEPPVKNSCDPGAGVASKKQKKIKFTESAILLSTPPDLEAETACVPKPKKHKKKSTTQDSSQNLNSTSSAGKPKKIKKKKDIKTSASFDLKNQRSEINDSKLQRKKFKIGKEAKKNFNTKATMSPKSRPLTKGEPQVSDNRLKAYGINPKKFKNKMKYGPKKF